MSGPGGVAGVGMGRSSVCRVSSRCRRCPATPAHPPAKVLTSRGIPQGDEFSRPRNAGGLGAGCSAGFPHPTLPLV